LKNLLAAFIRFCLVGYQAHRSRSVKTAIDGRHHRGTYTNKKRKEYRQISSNIGEREVSTSF